MSTPTDWPYYIDQAIETCSTTQILELIATGADLDPPEGEVPLCIAILKGELNLMRLLLAHGANPRIRNDLPLVCAVMMDDIETTKELLELGADVNHTNPHLSFLRRKDLFEYSNYGYIIGYIEDHCNSYILFKVVMCKSVKMLELLISHGADLTIHNYLPLRSCALQDMEITEIISILIAHQNHPPHILRQTFIDAIYNHHFVTANKLLSYLTQDNKLASDILGNGILGKGWYDALNDDIIIYCLDNLDCTHAIDELKKYVKKVSTHQEINISIFSKIMELGIDLTPYAVDLVICALQYKNDDIIKFINQHCNIDTVTTQIVDRIHGVIRQKN